MQGVDTNSTLKNLIYMYKGSNVCAHEALDFKIAHATPAGRLGDSSVQGEMRAHNFLQCY